MPCLPKAVYLVYAFGVTMTEISSDDSLISELNHRFTKPQMDTIVAAKRGLTDITLRSNQRFSAAKMNNTQSIEATDLAMLRYYTEVAAGDAIEEVLASKQGTSLSSGCQEYLRRNLPTWLTVRSGKSLSLLELLDQTAKSKEFKESLMSLTDDEFTSILDLLFQLQLKFFDDKQMFISTSIMTQPKEVIKKALKKFQPSTFESGLSFPEKQKKKNHHLNLFYLLSDFGDRLLRVVVNLDHPAQEKALNYIQLLQRRFGAEIILPLLAHRVIGEDIINFTDIIPWLRDLLNAAEDEDDPLYKNLADSCINIIQNDVTYLLLTTAEVEDGLNSIPIPDVEDTQQIILNRIRHNHTTLETFSSPDDDSSFFIERNREALRQMGIPDNIDYIAVTSPKEKNTFGYHSYHLLIRFAGKEVGPSTIIVVNDFSLRSLTFLNTIDPYTMLPSTNDRMLVIIDKLIKDELVKQQKISEMQPVPQQVLIKMKQKGPAKQSPGPLKRGRPTEVDIDQNPIIRFANEDIRPNQYHLAIAKDAFKSVRDGNTRKELENAIERYNKGLRHGKFIVSHRSPGGLPLMEIKTRHWRIIFEIREGTAYYLTTVAKKDFDAWMKNIGR